jgi:outer membrane protein OmpA-like peptidoglycan-associated protein
MQPTLTRSEHLKTILHIAYRGLPATEPMRIVRVGAVVVLTALLCACSSGSSWRSSSAIKQTRSSKPAAQAVEAPSTASASPSTTTSTATPSGAGTGAGNDRANAASAADPSGTAASAQQDQAAANAGGDARDAAADASDGAAGSDAMSAASETPAAAAAGESQAAESGSSATADAERGGEDAADAAAAGADVAAADAAQAGAAEASAAETGAAETGADTADQQADAGGATAADADATTDATSQANGAGGDNAALAGAEAGAQQAGAAPDTSAGTGQGEADASTALAPGPGVGIGGDDAGAGGASAATEAPDIVGVVEAPGEKASSHELVMPQTLGGMLPLTVGVDGEGEFDFDRAVLREDVKPVLDQLAARLKEAEFDTLEITGHTDRIGTEEYNQYLSERRAWAVARYLVKQGIPASKLRVVGKGMYQPLTRADECVGLDRQELIACVQKDRRVEISASIRRTDVDIR